MFTLNCKGRLLVLDRPAIMGIINVTPDSFYNASRFQGVDEILGEAARQIKDGATILDIGGQSTRPGSELISADEELKRVILPIEMIIKEFPEAIISIDTFYAKVAKEAVHAGASIVNDISGGSLDGQLIETVVGLNVPYILTHIKGSPQNMQANPHYENVVKEVLDYFITGIEQLKQSGIIDLLIDPGFGFGKTAAHNFNLLHQLSVFKIIGRPLVMGISRKATIYKTLSVTSAEALNGTTVLNTIGLLNGANILRVHDVKEAVECVKLIEAYKNAAK